MSTKIHAEISKKNPYWINKHRYYELKHFCLQYDIWNDASKALLGLQHNRDGLEIFANSGISNPTERAVIARDFYISRMSMIKSAADLAAQDLADYIIIGVTKGLTYDVLRARYSIPCCRETYYNLYRKFFWNLSKLRE